MCSCKRGNPVAREACVHSGIDERKVVVEIHEFLMIRGRAWVYLYSGRLRASCRREHVFICMMKEAR